jgi:hypothetical protein
MSFYTHQNATTAIQSEAESTYYKHQKSSGGFTLNEPSDMGDDISALD